LASEYPLEDTGHSWVKAEVGPRIVNFAKICGKIDSKTAPATGEGIPVNNLILLSTGPIVSGNIRSVKATVEITARFVFLKTIFFGDSSQDFETFVSIRS